MTRPMMPRRARLPLANALLAALTVWVTPAGAAESAYTTLNLDACKTVVAAEPGEPGGDYVVLSCAGYKGHDVLFKEGDLRQAIYFGRLAQPIIDEAFDTFAQFNHVAGGKVEWRLDAKGMPRAAILRIIVENINPDSGMPDKATEGQVLVISRVGRAESPIGCVAGYVDALANPDANQRAREVADTIAPDFPCGKVVPAFHGKRSEKAGQPTNTFPDTLE